MKILGIDPGTIITGYGLIEVRDGQQELVLYGALKPPADLPITDRLKMLHSGITDIILRHMPAAVAVEQPFVARNVRSALAIGRAQAVALLAAAQNDVPAFEYAPAQIKQTVASYGASSKQQVQEMVRLQLRMDKAPQPADAADALAVAICHACQSHLGNLVAEQEGK